MRPVLASLIVVVLGAAAACSATISSPASSEIARDSVADFQTDSLVYTFRATDVSYEGRIGVQFTNKTDGTAYFVNCAGATNVGPQKLVDGVCQAVWAPILPACLTSPIVVARGGQFDLGFSVFGGFPGCNCAPQFSIANIAGVYRAVWPNALSSYQPQLPFGVPLPEEHRVSNRFVIAVQSRSGG